MLEKIKYSGNDPEGKIQDWTKTKRGQFQIEVLPRRRALLPWQSNSFIFFLAMFTKANNLKINTFKACTHAYVYTHMYT